MPTDPVPASAAQTAQVRRMVADADGTAFTDAQVAAAIERYPLPDAAGAYDLALAAAALWDERAALLAQDFDFAADGGDYKRSQAHAQALAMARRFRAQRAAQSRFQAAVMGTENEGSEP